VEKLQNLMLQIAGKDNPNLNTTMIDIDNFDDFDKNVKEISSIIDNFIDNRTALRSQKIQIKEIAEKWYKACFPFVVSV
jgi:predicted unusual protein kinase regulating ubiquinone biosynthesis (AarF/ABC1/UbiB family)